MQYCCLNASSLPYTPSHLWYDMQLVAIKLHCAKLSIASWLEFRTGVRCVYVTLAMTAQNAA